MVEALEDFLFFRNKTSEFTEWAPGKKVLHLLVNSHVDRFLLFSLVDSVQLFFTDAEMKLVLWECLIAIVHHAGEDCSDNTSDDRIGMSLDAIVTEEMSFTTLDQL